MLLGLIRYSITSIFLLHLFMFFLLQASTSFAKDTNSGAITYRDSLQFAFNYSPLLKSVQEKHQESLYTVQQAKASYFPTIGVWGGIGVQAEDSANTSAYDVDNQPAFQSNAGIQLNQLIWDGGIRQNVVRSQEYMAQSNAMVVLDNATYLAYNTIAAHTDLLRRQKLVGITIYNVNEHKKIHKLLKSRHKNGLSTIADVEQVESRLARAEAALLAHRSGLQNAKANYARLTGKINPGSLTQLKNPTILFKSVSEVRDICVTHNHTILADIALIRALISQRDSTTGKFIPSLSVGIGPSYSNINRVDSREQFTWDAMLNMNWNIFNGGADSAQRKAISAQIRATNQSLHARMDGLSEQIKFTFDQTVSTKNQAKFYAQAKKASRSVTSNYFKQFQTGRKDLISVLDAENEYYSSAVAEIISRTDSVLGHYRLMALSGTLLIYLQIDTTIFTSPIIQENLPTAKVSWEEFSQKNIIRRSTRKTQSEAVQ